MKIIWVFEDMVGPLEQAPHQAHPSSGFLLMLLLCNQCHLDTQSHLKIPNGKGFCITEP